MLFKVKKGFVLNINSINEIYLFFTKALIITKKNFFNWLN